MTDSPAVLAYSYGLPDAHFSSLSQLWSQQGGIEAEWSHPLSCSQGSGGYTGCSHPVSPRQNQTALPQPLGHHIMASRCVRKAGADFFLPVLISVTLPLI